MAGNLTTEKPMLGLGIHASLRSVLRTSFVPIMLTLASSFIGGAADVAGAIGGAFLGAHEGAEAGLIAGVIIGGFVGTNRGHEIAKQRTKQLK